MENYYVYVFLDSLKPGHFVYEDIEFEYGLDNITPSSISAIDFRLQAQYQQMFNKDNVYIPQDQVSQQPKGKTSVINLFDDKK